jgi:TetR/AcrR family transcriptional regulator
MRSESNIKQENIVEAAMKRFAHFGIAKTTLTEIAEDLSISKPTLAYYFPDKQGLIQAVKNKITQEYLQAMQQEFQKAATVEAALLKLTEIKGQFLEKYFMLSVEAESLTANIDPAFSNWKDYLKNKDLELLTPLFETGVATGELRPLDPLKTGSLLLDTLYAFSRCIQSSGGVPDLKAFREIISRQQEVIRLFYQGLKKERLTA